MSHPGSAGMGTTRRSDRRPAAGPRADRCPRVSTAPSGRANASRASSSTLCGASGGTRAGGNRTAWTSGACPTGMSRTAINARRGGPPQRSRACATRSSQLTTRRANTSTLTTMRHRGSRRHHCSLQRSSAAGSAMGGPCRRWLSRERTDMASACDTVAAAQPEPFAGLWKVTQCGGQRRAPRSAWSAGRSGDSGSSGTMANSSSRSLALLASKTSITAS
jgi:hypothetical protein